MDLVMLMESERGSLVMAVGPSPKFSIERMSNRLAKVN